DQLNLSQRSCAGLVLQSATSLEISSFAISMEAFLSSPKSALRYGRARFGRDSDLEKTPSTRRINTITEQNRDEPRNTRDSSEAGKAKEEPDTVPISLRAEASDTRLGLVAGYSGASGLNFFLLPVAQPGQSN